MFRLRHVNTICPATLSRKNCFTLKIPQESGLSWSELAKQAFKIDVSKKTHWKAQKPPCVLSHAENMGKTSISASSMMPAAIRWAEFDLKQSVSQEQKKRIARNRLKIRKTIGEASTLGLSLHLQPYASQDLTLDRLPKLCENGRFRAFFRLLKRQCKANVLGLLSLRPDRSEYRPDTEMSFGQNLKRQNVAQS